MKQMIEISSLKSIETGDTQFDNAVERYLFDISTPNCIIGTWSDIRLAISWIRSAWRAKLFPVFDFVSDTGIFFLLAQDLKIAETILC